MFFHVKKVALLEFETIKNENEGATSTLFLLSDFVFKLNYQTFSRWNAFEKLPKIKEYRLKSQVDVVWGKKLLVGGFFTVVTCHIDATCHPD